jgi:hypothetical protein
MLAAFCFYMYISSVHVIINKNVVPACLQNTNRLIFVMLCVLDKKGVSLCRLKKTTRQDLNHAFILGAPVCMAANSTITVLSSITNIHPPTPSQSYFRILSHILCSSPIKNSTFLFHSHIIPYIVQFYPFTVQCG